MNDKIKSSIDKIEPESGAKERMYQSILKKAAKTEKPKLSPAKVARIALPLAACVCVVILGVTRLYPGNGIIDDPSESTVLGGNPYVEVEDASAFAPLGFTVDAPENAADKSYAITGGDIAEIRFSLDGHSYTLRASRSADISGMNGEIISREPLGNDAELITMRVDGVGECRLIEWTSDSVHLSLTNSDGAAGGELRAVFEKLQ